MNEMTRKKICSFWWTSSNRRVTNMHHRTEASICAYIT